MHYVIYILSFFSKTKRLILLQLDKVPVLQVWSFVTDVTDLCLIVVQVCLYEPCLLHEAVVDPKEVVHVVPRTLLSILLKSLGIH